METNVDFLILGGGSAGFTAVKAAQRLGRSVALVEPGQLGGACLNRGCVPSKWLIERARFLHAHAQLLAQVRRPDASLFAELVRQKDDLLRSRRVRYVERAEDGDFLTIGSARFVDPHTVEVNGKRVRGLKVLIATGAEPVLPDIEGLGDVPYLTSDLLAEGMPRELTELPDSMLIVGGGYIALELGQMFQRFGTRVTLLERGPALLAKGYEPEVGKHLTAILSEEGMQLVFDADVRSVRGRDAVVTACLRDGRAFTAGRLLVATGRRPATRELGLDRAGIAVNDAGEILVDAHLRTSLPHVFAAGDVIGRQVQSQMATPLANEEAKVAAHNALADAPPRSVDHRVAPRAMFTDPEVAVVGRTASEVRASGGSCLEATIAMDKVARAGLAGQPAGFAKMVVEEQTRKVLGVTLVGHNAGEVIHEAAMAMRFGATASDFASMLHVFPTMAEALKLLGEQF